MTCVPFPQGVFNIIIVFNAKNKASGHFNIMKLTLLLQQKTMAISGVFAFPLHSVYFGVPV